MAILHIKYITDFLLCPLQGFPGRDGSDVSTVQILCCCSIICLCVDNYSNNIYNSASGTARVAWKAGKIVNGLLAMT